MSSPLEYINPAGLPRNPAFSQIVVTQGPGRTVYIGGQNAVSADGKLSGPGDLRAQTTQTMKNLETAVEACGGTLSNLIRMAIYVVQGQSVLEAFQSAQPFMVKMANPPIVTVLVVAGLANPAFLIEIEGIAFLPE
jgi:enamine deaminase RidA (YjgF/YER057c/UK114 family)